MSRAGGRRGRPLGLMTHRRQAVLREMALAAEGGERISWAELARRVGLHDFRSAKRIAREIGRYGLEAVK